MRASNASRLFLALVSAFFCPTLVHAQGLSPVEAAIVRAVDSEKAEALALLERIVNINSGTMNLAGVVRMKDVVTPQLEALGFKTRWTPMETAVGRAGDLVAEHACPAGSGRCGKRLLLIGHLDTVFEPDSSFQKFSRAAASIGTASGPGTVDMKGGLVVMLSALKAMKVAGVLERTEMTIVLSGDEERFGHPSSESRRSLIESGKHSDVALEFESTSRIDGKDAVRIARRSSTSWVLEATGETGHSSQIFKDPLGFGAVYELVRVLNAFREQLPEDGLTFNVGMLLGGSTLAVNDALTGGTITGKTNVIPPIAYASGDLRTLNNEQTARVMAKMKAIVAEHLPNTGATLTFDDGYPAMAETDASRALVQQLFDINAAAGLPAMTLADVMTGGAGDIAFVAPDVPAGLVGVGAAGSGTHADNETVFLDSLPNQAKRTAILMHRLAQP